MDKIHGLIEGHESASDKLTVVKEDTHNERSRARRSQGRIVRGKSCRDNGMGSSRVRAEGGNAVQGSSRVGKSDGGRRGG
jgi:hypothetical protein